MRSFRVSVFAFAALVVVALPALAQELTFDDVLGLKELGYSDDDILSELERAGSKLVLTPVQTQMLRAAGAGDRLLARLAGQEATEPVGPRLPAQALDMSDPQGSAQSQGYIRKFQGVKKVDVWEKIERYEEILFCAEANRAPGWIQVWVRFSIAANLLHAGQIERGLAELERAASEGYTDVGDWHCMIPRALWSHPRVRKAYEGLRLSSADNHELIWLRGENSATWHDTNMMVTGNMNRQDSDYTEIVQTRVPTRPTSSPMVIGNREYLRYAQAQQKETVMSSDMSRINHLLNRRIIDNYPGGASKSEYERQLEIEESRRIARRAYEVRVADVAHREFSLPAGATSEPLPLPALGSLKDENIPESTDMPERIDRPAEPPSDGTNDMRLRTGDRWVYRREIAIEGAEKPLVARVTDEVTGVGGGHVAYRTVIEGDGTREVEETGSRIKTTQREQLVWSLGRQGRVRVIDYATEMGERVFQGRRVRVRVVKMRYAWGSGDDEAEWSCVAAVSMDEEIRGDLEGTLETAGRRITIVLESFTPGR